MSFRNYVLLCVVTAVFLVGPQGGGEAFSAASDKWDLWSDSNAPSIQDRQRAEKPTEQVVTPSDTSAVGMDKKEGGENPPGKTVSAPVEPALTKQETVENASVAPKEAQKAEKPVEQATVPSDVPAVKASKGEDAVSQPIEKTVSNPVEPSSDTQVAETPGAVAEKASPAGSTESAVNEQAKPTEKKSAEGNNPTNTAAVKKDGTGDSYVIGPGDLLDISVWKDEALTRIVVVLPDGKITFPLIGEVSAAGKTVGQIKEYLIDKLTAYVPELVLNVEVKQSNSMFIYVIGRVNQPGKQILNSSVTVLQALAMAGGPNPFANRNKIKVFRKDGDKTVIHPFHYNDVVSGEDLDTNIALQRGDVIVVP